MIAYSGEFEGNGNILQYQVCVVYHASSDSSMMVAISFILYLSCFALYLPVFWAIYLYDKMVDVFCMLTSTLDSKFDCQPSSRVYALTVVLQLQSGNV